MSDKQTSLSRLSSLVVTQYFAIPDSARNVRYEAHWWDHVSRVVRNVSLLADEEGVTDQRNLLLAAALCHDIIVEENGKDDVIKSSVECKRLMLLCGFLEQDADLASSLILATDTDVRTPDSFLEMLLYTADKLDLFGVDGTIRLVIQEAHSGLTVRDELAHRIATRQQKWLKLMRSFAVGSRLVEEQARTARLVLESLAPVEIAL